MILVGISAFAVPVLIGMGHGFGALFCTVSALMLAFGEMRVFP